MIGKKTDRVLLIGRYAPRQERGLHILRGFSMGKILLEMKGSIDILWIFHLQGEGGVKGNSVADPVIKMSGHRRAIPGRDPPVRSFDRPGSCIFFVVMRR